MGGSFREKKVREGATRTCPYVCSCVCASVRCAHVHVFVCVWGGEGLESYLFFLHTLSSGCTSSGPRKSLRETPHLLRRGRGFRSGKKDGLLGKWTEGEKGGDSRQRTVPTELVTGCEGGGVLHLLSRNNRSPRLLGYSLSSSFPPSSVCLCLSLRLFVFFRFCDHWLNGVPGFPRVPYTLKVTILTPSGD